MSDKKKYTEIWKDGQIESLYKRFLAIVGPFEIPLIETVIKKISEIFVDRKELSMFEIGAGSGKHTLAILGGVSEKHHIKYTGIDVSSAQQKQFEKTATLFPKNIEFKKYTLSSWQEYLVTQKYDIVLAQHSWYGIGRDIKNFKKIEESLSNDGVCFILINSKINMSQIAMQNNGESPFNSEDLDTSLTACGLSFERIRSYNDTYSRESFYENGRLTDRGLDYFSYLYRRDLRGDEQDVIDTINNAPDEAFRFPTDLIIIRK